MAEVSREDATVNARILYWGIDGAGKSSNLQAIRQKLRPDHRGELREVPTRLDPTVSYEVLPIELGDIAGVKTRIQLIAAPGHPDQAPTRMQLLDQVDGIVLVVDAQRDRVEENVASFDELRRALSDYGRALEEIPLVVQYNKTDLGDPYVLEELHKKLDVGAAAAFEAVAVETTGVLQTLSTISKRVIRTLREQGVGVAPAPPPPPPSAGNAAPPPGEPLTAIDAPVPTPPATPSERMEEAILAENAHPEADSIAATAESAGDGLSGSWEEVSEDVGRGDRVELGHDMTIVSVGQATRAGERAVRVPMVLGDGDGNTTTVVLTVRLDPLME